MSEEQQGQDGVIDATELYKDDNGMDTRFPGYDQYHQRAKEITRRSRITLIPFLVLAVVIPVVFTIWGVFFFGTLTGVFNTLAVSAMASTAIIVGILLHVDSNPTYTNEYVDQYYTWKYGPPVIQEGMLPREMMDVLKQQSDPHQ